MRSLPIIGLFLLFLGSHSFAQTGTIKGVVINSRTYERLPFASAFINNTTIGTSANEKGEFILKNIPIGQHELVVTFVGHHYYQSKIVVNDTIPMTITVRLKSNEMREVKVQSKRDKNWQRQYEKFKKLFLGSSTHAMRCEILNPWVLDFETNNVGYFKARASDVLQIENYSLGYRLFYQLKTFSMSSKEFTINGNIRFKPMETPDSATMNQWIKNRQEVYEGSSRHLFKSIVERRLAEEGFQLYRDNTTSGDIIRMAGFLSNVGHEITHYSITDLTYDESIAGEYKIQFPQRLEVHYLLDSDEQRIYRNVIHPISWVEVENDFLIIDPRGIVLNPYNMQLMGIMSEERVAEFLPFDFQPLPTKKAVQPLLTIEKKKPVNMLSYLLEKPYLHTDKSYYYPNETVWFRGYMNYATPVFKDSLSQVLYVDVIDKSKKVVVSKIFPIVKGSVEGSLSIPPTIDGGDYVLRAYTRWQLNFDASLVFVKPLKVLEYTEVGRTIGNTSISYDTTNALKIDLEKDSVKTRDRISVKIGVKDFLENFIPANFSVSVTDVKQVVPTINETTISSVYEIPAIPLPDSLPRKVEFTIQQGIDFNGRLVMRKDKPEQGIITVLQQNTSQVFMITTEENGSFAFSNLKLYDSAKLSVLAKTL
ncbi:MAG TPA: carboxypeptidase-like regulatory domain-containing protein, partial [Chryseolinea sp.]|nr:carboxypeptidase-like regulatory domain-containing protein [Chryseolinea sp.]